MIFKNLNKFEGENTYLLLQSYRVPRLISELSFEEISQIIEEPWPDYMESIFEEFYVPINRHTILVRLHVNHLLFYV